MKTKFKSFFWAVCHPSGGAACAGAALLLLTATINIQAQYNYTTLSVPGASQTSAYGISDNDIVGYYFSSPPNENGFLYDGSSYTTLNVPGAVVTYALGISGNDIVGYYENSSGGTSYGFIYNGNSYTILSVPGAGETRAYGISGNNIVGSYENSSGNYEGFLYDGSGYPYMQSIPKIPKRVNTYAKGIIPFLKGVSPKYFIQA